MTNCRQTRSTTAVVGARWYGGNDDNDSPTPFFGLSVFCSSFTHVRVSRDLTNGTSPIFPIRCRRYITVHYRYHHGGTILWSQLLLLLLLLYLYRIYCDRLELCIVYYIWTDSARLRTIFKTNTCQCVCVCTIRTKVDRGGVTMAFLFFLLFYDHPCTIAMAPRFRVYIRFDG